MSSNFLDIVGLGIRREPWHSRVSFSAPAMSVHQFIQTTTQLDQLARLDAHFRAQREAAALHASLSQALFETEQMAKRVALTFPQDAFAAAIISYDWLVVISGIEPANFSKIEHKRAFFDARQTLLNAYRRAELDPPLGNMVGQYLQCRLQLDALLHAMDGDPNAFIARARYQYSIASAEPKESSTGRKRSSTGPTMVFVGILFLSILFAFLGSTALASVTFLYMLLAGFVALVSSLSSTSAKSQKDHAERRFAIQNQTIQAYESFMANPNAGGFLRRIWNEHPLLFNEPIPSPDAPSEPRASQLPVQTYVERRVIEKRIVVTRCRFCQQMTPVDGMSCQNCGAPGFGG